MERIKWKKEPLVSVIIPAFNGEKYIGDAIESILHQTYINWELIIIDDCSTDETLKIINSYTDSRITLFCNKNNKGIAESTNKGIEKSKGKYIALLDDDDVAEYDRLTLQVDYLEKHSEIDILVGRTTLIDEKGQVIDYCGIPRNNPRYIKAVLLFKCMDFMNSTAMIRRDFIKKYNLYYKNDCYGMQDYRFYIECSKVGNISTINKFLLKYRIHEASETNRNFEKYKVERAKKYAQFQRYSLEKSGFRLDEESLELINKVLAEKDGKCDSKQEIVKLYQVFQEILKQGKAMRIDYLYELEHVCRINLSNQLIRLEGLF